jgi:type II secretory pathway pseudopilin PulG
MKTSCKAFTVIELVAVIVIIVLLTVIVLPSIFGNRGQANSVRSRDEAAALNSAEGAWYEYRTKTGPALTGIKPILDTYSTVPANRINNLQSGGYLASYINPADVLLNTTSDPPLWTPAYP